MKTTLQKLKKQLKNKDDFIKNGPSADIHQVWIVKTKNLLEKVDNETSQEFDFLSKKILLPVSALMKSPAINRMIMILREAILYLESKLNNFSNSDILILFKHRLKELIETDSIIIGQAINTENNFRKPFAKEGVTGSKFSSVLRQLIANKYLDYYDSSKQLDVVVLTNEGYNWATQDNEKKEERKETKKETEHTINLFPEEEMKVFPADVAKICSEFNFNFKNEKEISCLLLLRRLLPLSIVRKFQQLEKEDEIKNQGEYLETKSLVGKIAPHLKESRRYKEIMSQKPLIDST